MTLSPELKKLGDFMIELIQFGTSFDEAQSHDA